MPENAPKAQQPTPTTTPCPFAAPDGPCAADVPVRAAASRRSFLATALGVMGMVAFPWRWAQAKKVGLKLGQVVPLKHVGGSTTVTIKGHEMLLIRDTQKSVRAINPMCTHKACKVFYKAATNDLGCKCHKSQFSLGGKVLGGPAPKPLQTFAAKLQGQQIVIDLP